MATSYPAYIPTPSAKPVQYPLPDPNFNPYAPRNDGVQERSFLANTTLSATPPKSWVDQSPRKAAKAVTIPSREVTLPVVTSPSNVNQSPAEDIPEDYRKMVQKIAHPLLPEGKTDFRKQSCIAHEFFSNGSNVLTSANGLAHSCMFYRNNRPLGGRLRTHYESQTTAAGYKFDAYAQ